MAKATVKVTTTRTRTLKSSRKSSSSSSRRRRKKSNTAAAISFDQPVRTKLKHRYMADIQTGLTKEQVAEYTSHGWDNRSVAPPSKTVSQIIKGNTLTYFNGIFLLLSILLIIAGSYRDLSFLPIIIANAMIGIVQEIAAKNTLDKLNVLNAVRCSFSVLSRILL